ncbi:haloalkane dehalogenase [Ciceribacter ferrooxidans]|nr:haloalkane dehalogenase [Ciceribacter ferrooxidans]
MLKTLAVAALVASSSLVASRPAAAQDVASKLPALPIAEELTIPRREIAVLGSTMSYLEQGKGEVVLFLHGNPSAAYLWRNVIPSVSLSHRAVAVDLIGMGHSGKPDIQYGFADHARYLDAFVEAMGLERITLVGHDWGAALAWDFARRHPDKVVRLAFMEGVLPPAFPQPSYEAMGKEMGGMFRAMRDPQEGRRMIMENNMFVEQILPMMINRSLGEKARREYGLPYRQIGDRLPTWAWPRDVPIGGEPASSVRLMNDIQSFMAKTRMPVLLAYADPGVLVPPQAVPFYTGLIRNLETAFVGQGLHFIQEDQPAAIGRALADWLRRN